MSPYRTPGSVPPESPKKKVRTPMAWSIKPSKATKVFTSLMPLAASTVAEGLLYDTSLVSIGLKWGLAIGVGIFAIFFAGLTMVILDTKSASY